MNGKRVRKGEDGMVDRLRGGGGQLRPTVLLACWPRWLHVRCNMCDSGVEDLDES